MPTIGRGAACWVLAVSGLGSGLAQGQPMPSAPAALSERGPAVRPTDAFADGLLTEGRRLSPTINRQVAELEASDVVVYLVVRVMARSRTARLSFLSAHPKARYLKIEISRTNRREDAIGWLGHELQHAIEIASAGEVRDEASLERLYRRIGHPQDPQTWHFETEAAIRAGARVAAELRAPATGLAHRR